MSGARNSLTARPSSFAFGDDGPPARWILSEIAASLSAEDDLESLLQRFLGPIIQLANADAGVVRVLTDEGNRMRIVGAMGLPADVLQHEADVGVDCGGCGGAIHANRIETHIDVHRCMERTACSYFGSECRQLVAVPLQHRGNVLGLYNLFLRQEKAISCDTAALLRAVGELLGLALENARYARQSLRVTLATERQLLANEVHDSLAQTLSYMKMRMALLDNAVREHDRPRCDKYLQDVNQALSGAYATLRELLTHFRSPMDPQGLLHALGATAATYQDRTGVVLEFDNRAPDLALSVEQELHVFHIIQEALANVGKHAAARRARLVIETAAGSCRITVEDDGEGIPRGGNAVGAAPSHFGLEIMRERARHLGGEVEITSVQGAGTRVELRFPAVGRVSGGSL